jgi:hypothetical protein
MVSLPVLCTTAASFALEETELSTYSREANVVVAPSDPKVVRTAARVAGEVVGTIQYSVFTAPSPSWYTTTYTEPAGDAPAFGTSATDSAPPGPSATLLVPAATAVPDAVVNVVQEISSVPEAGVPSAR